jgi:hypothetical protein
VWNPKHAVYEFDLFVDNNLIYGWIVGASSKWECLPLTSNSRMEALLFQMKNKLPTLVKGRNSGMKIAPVAAKKRANMPHR